MDGTCFRVMFGVDKALIEGTPAGVSAVSSDEVQLPVAPPGTTYVCFYFYLAIIIPCMILFLGRTHFSQ